ncbi:MAG: 5-formyltetrahydrofolate cyclo-ligase [Methylococcales bacterium]|nr:5-formyltetrahydrofolate cyclo-ligase [Methylococcales bacterium]
MTEKKKQRRKAYDARNAQPDKENLSEIICNKFLVQSAYQQANTVMWYLHCRSEVRTLKFLIAELESSKNCVIPYCTVDQKGQSKLGLWMLESLSELIPGTWGILEPPKSRWGEKEVSPEQLDLVMVPGVAFDHQGGRMGNGAGYYDRLLQEVRPDTELTAVCYESQMCDKIIMEKHDVYMDTILTEQNSYKPQANGFDLNQK